MSTFGKLKSLESWKACGKPGKPMLVSQKAGGRNLKKTLLRAQRLIGTYIITIRISTK